MVSVEKEGKAANDEVTAEQREDKNKPPFDTSPLAASSHPDM